MKEKTHQVDQNNPEQLLIKAIKILKKSGIENPRLDAELLFSDLVGCKRDNLITKTMPKLSDEQKRLFMERINKRSKRYPLQYITNKTYFYSLEFKIEEGVAIPKPSTETLVEKVIESTRDKNLRITDIGTGCANIAISIAKACFNSFIWATDISSKALKLAYENIRAYRLEDRIKLLHGDLFEPLEKEGLAHALDLIVSNPPYVAEDEMKSIVMPEVLYEPWKTFCAGKDGLDIIRKIIRYAPEFLSSDGLLLMEIGHDHANKVKNLAIENGAKHVDLFKDLDGIDRIVSISW